MIEGEVEVCMSPFGDGGSHILSGSLLSGPPFSRSTGTITLFFTIFWFPVDEKCQT